MTDTFQDRPHQPTPKKRKDLKEQGEIPRSKDLNTALVVLTGLVLLVLFSTQIVHGLASVMHNCLAPTTSGPITVSQLQAALSQTCHRVVWLFLPMIAILLLVSFFGPMLVGGFMFNLKLINPTLGRLSLNNGFKRMFSTRSLVQLIVAVFKFAVIIGVALYILWQHANELLHLEALPLSVGLTHSVKLIITTLIATGATLLLFAAIDIPYQLWEHHKKLRMTTQELRDEAKIWGQ